MENQMKIISEISILDIASNLGIHFKYDHGRYKTSCFAKDHNDKTPSAFYYESTNLVSCFGCNNTWNPLTFTAEVLKCDNRTAIQKLKEMFPERFAHLKSDITKKQNWKGLSYKELQYLDLPVEYPFRNNEGIEDKISVQDIAIANAGLWHDIVETAISDKKIKLEKIAKQLQPDEKIPDDFFPNLTLAEHKSLMEALLKKSEKTF